MNCIFVDPLGNDETAAKNIPSQAFKTIKKAFAAVKNGDYIIIRGGEYVEHPTPLEPTSVIANTPGNGAALVLDGKENITIVGLGNPIINLSQHGPGILIKDCKKIIITNIEIRGQGFVTDPHLYYFALIQCGGKNERIHIHDCILRNSGNHGIAHLLGPRFTNNSIFERNLLDTGGAPQSS